MKRDDLSLHLSGGPFAIVADFRCARRRRNGQACGRLVATMVRQDGKLVIVTWRQPGSTTRTAVSPALNRAYGSNLQPQRRDGMALDVDDLHDGIGLACDRDGHGDLGVVPKGALLASSEEVQRTGRPVVRHLSAPMG